MATLFQARFKKLKNPPKYKSRIGHPESVQEEQETSREIQRRISLLKDAYGIDYEKREAESVISQHTVRCASCNYSWEILVKRSAVVKESAAVRAILEERGWREVKYRNRCSGEVAVIKICDVCLQKAVQSINAEREAARLERKRRLKLKREKTAKVYVGPNSGLISTISERAKDL